MHIRLAQLLPDAKSTKIMEWSKRSQETIEIKLQSLQQELLECIMIISTTDTDIQLTFYPS